MSAKQTPGPLAFDVEGDVDGGECLIFPVNDSERTVALLWDVADARLLVASYNSYDKHCGPRAVECAENDLLGEALGLVAELAEWLPQRTDLEDPDDLEALASLRKRIADLAKAGGK